MFAGPIADFLAAAISVVMLIMEHKEMAVLEAQGDRLEDRNE